MMRRKNKRVPLIHGRLIIPLDCWLSLPVGWGARSGEAKCLRDMAQAPRPSASSAGVQPTDAASQPASSQPASLATTTHLQAAPAQAQARAAGNTSTSSHSSCAAACWLHPIFGVHRLLRWFTCFCFRFCFPMTQRVGRLSSPVQAAKPKGCVASSQAHSGCQHEADGVFSSPNHFPMQRAHRRRLRRKSLDQTRRKVASIRSSKRPTFRHTQSGDNKKFSRHVLVRHPVVYQIVDHRVLGCCVFASLRLPPDSEALR